LTSVNGYRTLRHRDNTKSNDRIKVVYWIYIYVSRVEFSLDRKKKEKKTNSMP
jgi:hypothetical protein